MKHEYNNRRCVEHTTLRGPKLILHKQKHISIVHFIFIWKERRKKNNFFLHRFRWFGIDLRANLWCTNAPLPFISWSCCCDIAHLPGGEKLEKRKQWLPFRCSNLFLCPFVYQHNPRKCVSADFRWCIYAVIIVLLFTKNAYSNRCRYMRLISSIL